MNVRHLLALLVCMATTSLAFGDNCCGPCLPHTWYLLPKVGAAPGFFANRGYEMRVVPRSGISCPTSTIDVPCDEILSNPQDILQQNSCRLFKFSEGFTNRVLHVGGEIGWYATDCCAYFIDLIYNRAGGDCLNLHTSNFRAIDGCQQDNGCFSGNELTDTDFTINLNAYQAFGAYIGNRYFFDRMLCDRLSFWLGGKVGIMHRNNICATSELPAIEISEELGGGTLPAVTVSNTVICSSNALSGGLQLGFDICINECWSILIGAEVVATSPFKVNRNIPFALRTPVNSTASAQDLAQPTNIIAPSTGTFIQFPLWIGASWQWDWCCKQLCVA